MIDANFYKNNRIDFYKELLQEVKDLDISIVLANAGILRCGALETTRPEVFTDMIDVNTYHYWMIHKVFLPKLLERTK